MSQVDKNIKNELLEILSKRDKFKIVNLNGSFLTGKTAIVQSLISEIDFINNYNVYSYVNDWGKYNYLFDITSDFFENSNLQHPEFLFNESKYFVQSFFDNLSTLNIANKALFKEVNDYLLIENDDNLSKDLIEKVKSSLNNDLKKNLILRYYEISIECLIADLLNNFFPLNNNIDSLSNYLLTKEPIKLLLIFDDAQSVSMKIRKWFDMLFDYLHKRKLGELLLYDYKGKDSEIYLGEFFHIDVLFISRNKRLSITGDDILTEDLKLDYQNINGSEYENQISKDRIQTYPICGIPALAEAYSNIENEKDNSTAIYATNHLLKYIPELYQRAVIFASIFDEFNAKDINLFEEIEITENEFDRLIEVSDFIVSNSKKYRFDEKSKIILNGIVELLFENLDKALLNELSIKINKEYGNLSLEEFDLLRELAYYKKFDKPFLIEKVYDNSKSISNLIDKCVTKFEKDKSFFTLKSDDLKLLTQYNSIRDKANESDKLQKAEKYHYSYKKEIEQRNKILQEDVLQVGNEIKSLNTEKLQMETKSEELAKKVIELKNELTEIDEKLKPFVHQNSKRKSTINVLALIASVAIIFNSDRISEMVFNTTSNFDYIIIITLALLLTLYGNGLMRYFRMKFKSEEYHIIIQNQKNKESEYSALEKELDILYADIRAKDSKVEDLKKHIERMNMQIYENKLKIDN